MDRIRRNGGLSFIKNTIMDEEDKKEKSPAY
jgi:hypothetical protein